MQKLHTLETSVLVDMLETHAADYSRMLREGTSDKEFAKCSLTIKSIQTEINSRKQTADNTSTTEPNITFPADHTK
jgi:hypothetical protein